jgi:hypothetical protein
MQLYQCTRSFASVIGTRYYLDNKIDYQEYVNLPYSEQENFRRVNVEEGIRDHVSNELDIQD